MNPRLRLPALLLLLALASAALTAGCGESSLHSAGSDYNYYDVEKPMLLIDRQHFGGGQPVSPTRRSFPYGLDLTNASGSANAEQVRLRFRFHEGDRAVDDEVVQLGDLRPGETRRVEGSFEVPALYTGSDIELIWQYDSGVFRVDLKQEVYRIEDLGRISYAPKKR